MTGTSVVGHKKCIDDKNGCPHSHFEPCPGQHMKCFRPEPDEIKEIRVDRFDVILEEL